MKSLAAPNIIDVEASGFGSLSYPVEVGVVTSSGELFCSLIKPMAHWTHWDKSAEKVHGITRECLSKHGKPAQVVCHELNEKLTGLTLYSDAWAWDSQWVNRLFGEAKVDKRFFISPIESIATETQLLNWDDEKINVIACLGLERHRASSDAKIIQQTFVNTRNVSKNYPPLANGLVNRI